VAAGRREPLRLHRLRRVQKWLLSPRGTAYYFTISPALIGELTPHYAGWYAGDDP
jgi:hypothetical protein